jgi:peptidoglycan-associated lipoprotein
MLRTSALLAAFTFVLATGCAKKPAVHDNAPEMTAGKLPRPNVHVAEDLARICSIQFSNVERAPKFDFDDTSLLPEDRDVLEQVARCVTTGPLKGARLSLTGRADPRGEAEYNMVLGEHRADSVRDYLARLGVAADAMSQTSRGELDAEGKDEDGWRRDRRVDIALQ